MRISDWSSDVCSSDLGLPAIVSEALELVPANAHPMDVMRTGCSVLRTVLPERDGHPASEARDLADQLMASFGSLLPYWWHSTRQGRSIDISTAAPPMAALFLPSLRARKSGGCGKRG